MRLFEDDHGQSTYNYNRMLYTVQDAKAATAEWNSVLRASVHGGLGNTKLIRAWVWEWRHHWYEGEITSSSTSARVGVWGNT